MLRGIVAVLLGYVTALMLLALTYTGFAKWFPEDVPHYGSPLVMRAVAPVAALCICIGAVGGWITARFATHNSLQHVLVMVAVMVVLGLLKPMSAPTVEPLASHLAFLAGLALGALLGGKIGSTQVKGRDIAQ